MHRPARFRVVSLAPLLGLWVACDPGERPRYTRSSGVETGDTRPPVESGGPVDTERPPETGTGETAPPAETGDTEPAVPVGCGELEAQSAPLGLRHVAEADAALSLGDEYQGFHDARGRDMDGDGCADLMVVSRLRSYNQYYYSIELLPGPLVSTVLVEDASVASIRDERDHEMSAIARGDLDGDGVGDDWVLGASGLGDFAGAVYVFPEPLVGSYTESDARVTLWNASGLGSLGYVVSAGDANGDGVDDLAVGLSEYPSGQVFVFDGPIMVDATEAAADATIASVPDDCNWLSLPFSLDGDFQGDGLRDMALLTSGACSDGGRAVRVFEGPLEGVTTVLEVDQRVEVGGAYPGHHDLSVGRDSNGDGYDDILFSSSTAHDASAWLVLGGLDMVDSVDEAQASFDVAPYTVSLDQDLDADGLPEVAIGWLRWGWPTDDTDGAVLLYYGPVEGSYEMDEADAVFYTTFDDPGSLGRFVSGLGDTDGDGFEDILLSGYAIPGYIFRGGPR